MLVTGLVSQLYAPFILGEAERLLLNLCEGLSVEGNCGSRKGSACSAYGLQPFCEHPVQNSGCL